MSRTRSVAAARSLAWRSLAARLCLAWLVALVSLVSGVASLGGCAGTGRPRVVLWHAYRGKEEEALRQVLAAFQKEQGVDVEALAIPFDAYAAKLEAAVPHAHGPDLFIDAHERLGSYLQNTLVAPVGDAVPPSELATYDPAALAAATVGGQLYGVPLAQKSLALFVNDRKVPSAPTSFEALAKRGDLPSGSYPVAFESEGAFSHAPLLHAFGGRMVDGAGAFAATGPEAEASLAFLLALRRAGAVPEEPSGALVSELFASGKLSAVVSGPWFLADAKKAASYRVYPLPRLRETGDARLRAFLTVEVAFLAPEGAKNPHARALARHLGGLASARIRATVGKQVVATTAAWDDPAVKADRDLAAFHEAATESVPMPTSVSMRAAWVPLDQAIKKTLRGDASPHDALEEARARFDDAMKPPPPSPSPTPLLVVLSAVMVGLALLAVKNAREPGFPSRLRASLPAYRYVAHAAVVVFVLVVLPLVAGALTSFFAGTRNAPQYVGMTNYVMVLTARGGPLLGSGSFWLTLLVTVLWTVVNVTFHLGIGLGLGVLLSRPLLRLKALYRVLLILPWAVPSYVTALAWKGMFHRQYGAINALLHLLGAEPISWFSRFSTAFSANVATNVWLGFPFMMVVTVGALTAVPKDVLEAAEVDGATRWQRFRLVVMPLVAPALLPSVVLGSVWTFNMFNVVFLVSGGEPDGQTDILVSEAYRWAFTRNAQYGYAAAYAVLIFGLLLLGSKAMQRIGRPADQGAR